MGIVFSNNGETTLNGAIDETQTTVIVTSTLYFPTVGGGDYFYATIIKQDGTKEIVKATALAGSTYTVVREQDDTTGTAFSDGDKFQLRLPKVVLEAFQADIASNLAAITVNETDLAGTTNAGSVPAPSGTKMWFYQAAAPSQWTIDATVEDCLLALAGGTQAYNVAGGTGAEVGSWTQSTHVHGMNDHTHGFSHFHGQAAHSHTMGTHTHTGPSHRHTGPSHTHTYSGTTAETGSSPKEQGSNTNNVAVDDHTHTYSGTTGSGGTGNTGFSGTGNTGSTDPGDTNPTDAGDTTTISSPATEPTVLDTEAGSPVSTDRPLAAVGILATKD